MTYARCVSPVDRRGKLADRPFTHRVTRDTVMISWQGRVVKTLAGDDAARFRREVADLDDDGVQLLLAKLTGNFKRGNERREDG
jgi:hypothetical protein